MGKLQMLVDTNRLRTDIPVDLTQLVATGFFTINPEEKEGGIMLEDDVSIYYHFRFSEFLFLEMKKNYC